MKKFIINIILLTLILITFTACANRQETVDNKTIFTGEEEESYALGKQIQKQLEVDKQILEYIQDPKYTFDDPMVLINPYDISPLSALIIFQTEDETSIKVDINDYYLYTTVEKAENHVIPIYGLLDEYKNIVRLVNENNQAKLISIETEKFNGNRLRVEQLKEDKLDDRVYYLSPNFVENCVYDKYGNLLWYVKDDYAGDIEFLDNGHFMISDPNQGTNGVKINYSSFLEMDYLGRIYKQYITEFGYHHELVLLDNGDILTTGANDDSPFLEAVLFIMDSKTGKTKWSIDFYDKLHAIAPAWIESLGDQFDFVLNSIDYDPDNNNVLLSFRGIGVVTLFDLDSEEFIWMFGDPDNLPDEFDQYLLEREDDIKYPYGEHSAFFTKDGNYSFHNNDADQLNAGATMLSDYLDNYSTNVVFTVDEENRTVKTVWEYDADKKEWSKVAGMLDFLEDNHALITFGYSEKETAYANADKISINDTDYLQGIVQELDESNELLFRGTMDGLIFRTYKTYLYPETISNYEITDFEKVDGSTDLCEKINIDDIKKELLNAEKTEYGVYVLVNRFFVENEYDINDDVKVILVDENENAYTFDYKKKGLNLRVFNSGRYGQKFYVPDGRYKVYLNVNEKYLDTNRVIVFD